MSGVDIEPILVQKASVGGMFTLLLYELTLTLDREVELFWSALFTRTTALFLLNRYVSLAKYPVTLMTYVSVSQKSCDILIRLGEVVEIIPYIVWAAFSAMRAHALAGHDWRIALVVFALLCVPAGTNLYLFVQSVPLAYGEPLQCVYIAAFPEGVYIPILILTRACAILGDAIVIVVTWYKTFRGWRAAVAANLDVSLAQMLIRDGSIYFGVILALNVLHIASALTTAFSGSIAYFEEPLTAVIIARIMLNLREADQVVRSVEVDVGLESMLDFGRSATGSVAGPPIESSSAFLQCSPETHEGRGTADSHSLIQEEHLNPTGGTALENIGV